MLEKFLLRKPESTRQQTDAMSSQYNTKMQRGSELLGDIFSRIIEVYEASSTSDRTTRQPPARNSISLEAER